LLADLIITVLNFVFYQKNFNISIFFSGYFFIFRVKENSAIMKKRLVIGMTGASGAPLAIALLKAIRTCSDWEAHVVCSRSFLTTMQTETTVPPSTLQSLAHQIYEPQDIAAEISSGTFRTEGMVIIPCSMKTLAGIANGFSDNLILRAADVTIKEHRHLVLVARESPLSPIHLRNMLTLAQLGVTILPPVLTYYNHPESIEDMNNHIVGKVLSEFGLNLPSFRRWKD